MTSPPQLIPLESFEHGRRATVAGDWFRICEVLTPNGGEIQERTGDEESAVVILTGWHDLFAGGGSWIERGRRTSLFDGRPVALFLPPATTFRFARGHGDILRIGCRQPELDLPEDSQPKKKPLLAMAGSGKAFDPASGEWKPQEQMPNAPEALLPRRIESQDLQGTVVERVFPADYKALALCVDEIVVPAGTTVELSSLAGAWTEECLCYVVPAEGATASFAMETGEESTATGEAAFLSTTPPAVTARDGAVFVAFAWAGMKR